MSKAVDYLNNILIEKSFTDEELNNFFSEFNIDNYEKGLKSIKQMFVFCNNDIKVLPNIETVLSFFAFTSDPVLALIHFVRFLENIDNAKDAIIKITENKKKIKTLGRLFSESIYFSEILIKNPDYFYWLINNEFGQTKTKEEMLGELNQAAAEIENPKERLNEMRRFKNREVVRIGANDIMAVSDLQTTTGEISNLADVCLEFTYKHFENEMTKIHGVFKEKPKFTVISMGKLGGFELNYSSDIDIIFVCEGSGNADKSGISFIEFYTQIAQKISSSLMETTPYGYCFRVDTRLRPEGAKGRLVRTIDAYRAYYETRGKTWERQALIKARPSAGDMKLGERFMNLIEPFVYRKYLSFRDIQSIKHLKNIIETRVAQDGKWKTEVKLGEGGIRDIEFMVQFLQLLNGGSEPSIRTQNTLIALSRLLDVKSLSFEEVNFLEQAYIFLRNIEHKLQIMNYQQVHNLPTDNKELEKIAIRLGYMKTSGQKPADIFKKEYEENTLKVREIFRKNFKDLFENPDENDIFDILQNNTYDEEKLNEVFSRFGFKDSLKVYKLLHNFLDSSYKAKTYFADIIADLLNELSMTPDPDGGLVNFIKILEAYQAKDVLLEILSVNNEALSTFIKLCVYSQFLTDIIIANPGILDLLTEPNVLSKPKKQTEIKTVLNHLLSFNIPFEDAVYQLRNMENFRIGLRNIINLCDIRTTNWELSNLAYIILLSTFNHLKLELDKEKGECKTDWAFIISGKLAGKELGFGSDIDAIFVFDENIEIKDGYYAKQYFVELLNRTTNFLGKVTTNGQLYELDMRLRPNGRKSSLCIAFEPFEKYYKEKGEVWERLFLSRSNVIASSKEFEHKVRDVIFDFVFSEIDEKELKSKIIEMRKKIADAVQVKSKDKTHLSFKKWYGGLIDIEFLAEYLVILNGKNDKRIHKSNIVALLRVFSRYGYMNKDDALKLEDAYIFLRNVENILRIVHNYSNDFLPEDEKEFKLLTSRLGMEDESKENFLQVYNEYTFLIRELYIKYLGG